MLDLMKRCLMKRFATQLLLAFTLASTSSAVAASERPNILYFYVDDMGWGSIGPNGQSDRKDQELPHLITPTLDQLAAQGVTFTRSYGCTVCSPARSSQQSGFHQGHTFADRNDPDNAKKAMRADEILMGDALSKAGYATGYWGKWGYGGSKSQFAPVIENVQTLPTSHGYQHVVAELHHVRAHTFFQPTLWSAPAAPGSIGGLELIPNSMSHFAGKREYPNSPALQNHDAYPKTAYCDDVYCFSALDFVRNQAQNYSKTGQPFFGLLAVQVPHAPFGEIEKLPEWDAAYRDKPFFKSLAPQSKQWASMVTRIDGHFANILSALEDPNGDGDTADSIADNTLVIFQSDNGGPEHKARHEFAANGGLRGNKGQIYEGGIRIPTIVRWPSRITESSTLQAGTSTKQVIDVSDLLPTFCDLAGVDAPVGLDGVSLAPTLTGTGHQRKRPFLIHEAGNGQSIIRGQYKLIRNVVRKKETFELYNLNDDPSESIDIATKKRGLVEELKTLLLGERVTEPRGFANTYHHWTGKDGASTSKAKNWSDYNYENAGISYLTDNGAPGVSWTALMQNSGEAPSRAIADSDLEFLGLELRGNPETSATQTLQLAAGVNLTARNELRLSTGSAIELNGGTISSIRWVEVNPGGVLSGSGTVDAALYNHGTVAVQGQSDSGLTITADYRETSDSTLNARISSDKGDNLVVNETASLAGLLSISIANGVSLPPDCRIEIIRANRIEGRFRNINDQLTADDGTRFRIDYTDFGVFLIAE